MRAPDSTQRATGSQRHARVAQRARVLFVAPLPPPVTGHSLVSQVLLDALLRDHEVEIVDLSKDSAREGVDSFARVLQVGRMLAGVWRRNRRADVVYLTISESLAGNVKDLVIYLLCAPRLRRVYVHLHGGSIKRLLWDRRPLIHRINRFFLRRVGGAIISGASHRPVFDAVVERRRIHVVPNFAQDHLFVGAAELEAKFATIDPLRVIYVSSMRPKKGYRDLLEAFRGLDEDTRRHIRLDFAGRFDDPEDEAQFRSEITELGNVAYHGTVDDDAKRDLFAHAHVFSLPSALFEGQPISILEAYAAGCAVMATAQRGILDIFTPGVNGIEVAPESPASIRDALRQLLARRGELLAVAKRNWETATTSFRSAAYTNAIARILDGAECARAGVLAPEPTQRT